MKQLAAVMTAVVVLLGLARTTQADTINLAWNANTEANLAGYVVSYGTQANTYTSTFDSGNNTSQPLANLVKGTRYYFVVKAYNTSGVYSAASQEISGIASDAAAVDAGRADAGERRERRVGDADPQLGGRDEYDAVLGGVRHHQSARGRLEQPDGADVSTGGADRRHDVLLADRGDGAGRIDERADLESDHRGARQPGAGRVLCLRRGNGDDDASMRPATGAPVR